MFEHFPEYSRKFLLDLTIFCAIVIPLAAWAARSQQCHLRLLNGDPAPGAEAIRGCFMVNAHDGNPHRG